MKGLFFKLCFVMYLIGGISQIGFAQESIREGADELFNKGISLFTSGNYKDAQAKFSEARAIYDAIKGIINVEQKIKSCDEWITKCTKKIKGAENKNDNATSSKASGTSKAEQTKLKEEPGNSPKTSGTSRTEQPKVREKPDNFSIKEIKFENKGPLYLGQIKELNTAIRYTCDKETSVDLIIRVIDQGVIVRTYKKNINVKQTTAKYGEWDTLTLEWDVKTAGKYSFVFCRVANGISKELGTFGGHEIKDKPTEGSSSNVRTTSQPISLKVNEQALIFDANGGTKYITVTTNVSDWSLYGTSIPGFTITRVNSQVKVVCSPATSTASINDWFKIMAGDQEVKITVYREGKKVVTQSYEQSIKGNPFALRTSHYNIYHWGISAGYVSKKLKYKDLDGKTDHYGLLTDKSLPGIQAGIHYEGFFMPKICGLGVATGAYYEYYWQKGDTQSGDGFDDYYASYKEHNVYVPLNLLFRFDFSKKVNIALYGGIGANYGVGNKVEYKDASDDKTFEEKKGLYDYDEYGMKRFFMNIEYGGSVRIGRLSVNAKFFSPLTDWSEDKFYSEKPVKDMNLSVSFMF